MISQKAGLATLRALATDFDGTLAHNGTVTKATFAALQKLKRAGFHLILVTGRELHDLTAIFPEITWFDIAVMENGAVLYHPHTGLCEPLAAPAPSAFVAHLYECGLPLQVGEVILATWEPHEKVVLEAIKKFGLELQVIFNKGSVMVLPSGVNKATGLRKAAERLNLDVAQIAGIGDAENDHAFLEVCGFSAAVGNALPAIKQRVDEVMRGDHGKGVEELIDRLLAAAEAPREDSPV